MLVAGHTSALRRRSEIRAMPETEKPPAKPVDIYYWVERLYLKGVRGMNEKIEIKKRDFYEMMYLMEKILYIAER